MRPPPLFLIASRAAVSVAVATPRRRYFLSTTKQVILHNLALPSSRASFRYFGLLSIRGSSSLGPYWHHPTGSLFAETSIQCECPLLTSSLFSRRFLTALSALVRSLLF